MSDELKERAYRFALSILELGSMLPNTDEGRIMRKQLCKSGTSVGANLEKADGSLTLNDLVYKVDIAFKAAKETRYWSRIVIARKLLEEKVVIPHLGKCVELIKLLSIIIYKCLK